MIIAIIVVFWQIERLNGVIQSELLMRSLGKGLMEFIVVFSNLFLFLSIREGLDDCLVD